MEVAEAGAPCVVRCTLSHHARRAGGVLARWKKLGLRGFTTATNVGNAVATTVMSLPLPNFSTSFWLGHIIHLPGINNTSAAAVKAIAIDHAVAAGFGRGEWGGMYSSIRVRAHACLSLPTLICGSNSGPLLSIISSITFSEGCARMQRRRSQ